MDTKLKKWKAFISFLAFFLGVTLLWSGVSNAVWELRRYNSPAETMKNVFEKDYQNTQDFRREISNYLETFLQMATGGPVYNAYDFETGYEYETYIEQGGLRFGSNSAVISEDSWHFNNEAVEEKERLEEEKEWLENNKEAAKRMHEYFQKDKNLLYQVSFKGKELYTNAEKGTLDGLSGKAPEGYNFLLYFDGEKVKIRKDGNELSIYGDGFYDENKEWYLPGYQNFTVDEQTQKATVSMAVAKAPIRYLYGNYSTRTGRQDTSTLYWVSERLSETKERCAAVGITLGAGLIFMILYLIMRKDKKNADMLLARITGKVWFDVKVLLLVSVFLVPAFLWFYKNPQFLNYITEYAYTYAEANNYLFEYAFEVGGMFWNIVPAAFWVAYLFINDLRYGKKPWKHTLAGRAAAAFHGAELTLPFQRRMILRSSLLFMLILLMIVTGGVFLFGFVLTNSEIPFLWVGIYVIAALLLLFAAVLFAKRNREAAEDIGAVVDQISAIRGGNLTAPLPLPGDADLKKAADDLNDIQHGMSEALDQKIKSEHLKVELIANVSHDIKTPLTSIISYAELLREEEGLPPHVMDYIQILDNKAQRLKTMVQDVFEVSKATSGQLPVRIEVLDFGKLLQQTLADMGERIGKSTVTVRSEIPQQPVFISADGQRLYRVFQNLLQNALQYSLDGSRVYVTLTANGRTASASVKNTSKNEIQDGKDFTERFVRGDESRTDGGSGLGLSIAASFTEACGGRLTIQNNADLFVVTVEFPELPKN